jgi:uncharacterized repeat protein (TIGR01451 family)
MGSVKFFFLQIVFTHYILSDPLENPSCMKTTFTLFFLCLVISASALDPNHFTITRVTAPYFIVDGNSPSTITQAYVGFEVKNNSNSATTYSGLKFTITSIGTSVVGQTYTIVAPVSGIVNVGTLAPGETKVCYYYISYPANVTPQATFNVQLSDATASSKTQSFIVANRSSISANAGGTATQTFTNQDLIGGTIIDDVTYAVGNVQNGDESDFQVAVSSLFDPTKITLLSTKIIASSVPGIPVNTTDSLYFITGNGSNGATVTVRWTFRITGTNFTTYLLPCAGSTSGSTNYKYALNTSLGSGTPVTVSSSANPLTISKTSNQSLYVTNGTATFTITIANPGIYDVTIDKVTDTLPTGFTFVSFDAASQVTAANSTSVPLAGATGGIAFEGGVVSGGNTSYSVPAGGSIIIKYTATAPPSPASNLVTTAKDYIAATQVGSAQNTVSVSITLPVSLVSFKANWINEKVKLDWSTANENNSSFFEVERSNDNNNFIPLEKIAATGNSSVKTDYSFTDTFPQTGINYYRLKIADLDQHFKYSSVIAMKKTKNNILIKNIYPNPFINKIELSIYLNKEQSIRLNLLDYQGNLLTWKEQKGKTGTNTILFNNLKSLCKGIYLLQLITEDGMQNEKLIKIN